MLGGSAYDIVHKSALNYIAIKSPPTPTHPNLPTHLPLIAQICV